MNRHCLFVVVASALAATPAIAQPAKSLTLQPKQVTVVRGQRFQLSLAATTPEGTQFTPQARFRFAGGNVTPYGLVMAHRPGKHTVTAQYRNLKATATVTVVLPGHKVGAPGAPAKAAKAAIELRRFDVRKTGSAYRVSFQAVANNRQARMWRVLRVRPDGRTETINMGRATVGGKGYGRTLGVPGNYKALEIQLLGQRNALLYKVRRELKGPQPKAPQAAKPGKAAKPAIQVLQFSRSPRGSQFSVSFKVRTVNPAARVIRVFRVAPNGKRAGSLGGGSAKMGGTYGRRFQLPRAAAKYIEIEVYGANNAVLQTVRKQIW